jgi:hypothetical protein
VRLVHCLALKPVLYATVRIMPVQLYFYESEIIEKLLRRSSIHVVSPMFNVGLRTSLSLSHRQHTQSLTARVAWHTFGALYHCDVAAI